MRCGVRKGTVGRSPQAARDSLQCSVQAGAAELAARAGRASLRHAAALSRLALRASAPPNPLRTPHLMPDPRSRVRVLGADTPFWKPSPNF